MNALRKYVSCLRELPIFGGLDSPAFRAICLATARRKFAKGSYLFRQGETSDTGYLIKAGKVKLVSLNDEGREVISANLKLANLLERKGRYYLLKMDRCLLQDFKIN